MVNKKVRSSKENLPCFSRGGIPLKRAHIIPNETIKWILYIAILIALGYGIVTLVGKFG